MKYIWFLQGKLTDSDQKQRNLHLYVYFDVFISSSSYYTMTIYDSIFIICQQSHC